MSKELPYFKFFPSEWLIGKISFQPLELQGAFIQCVCVCWQKNGLFTWSDVEHRISSDLFLQLIQKSFIHEANSSKCLANASACLTDKNIQFSIDFLDEQLGVFSDISDKRKAAGIKGGKANAKQKKANAKHLTYIRKEKKRKEEGEKDIAPANAGKSFRDTIQGTIN